jgi:hypothetical protein
VQVLDSGLMPVTAQVQSTIDDLNSENNQDLVYISVARSADISASWSPLFSGGPESVVSFELILANAGFNTAEPAIGTSVTADLDSLTWTCEASAGASCPANGTGNLDHTAIINTDGNVTYSFSATISGASLYQPITVQASAIDALIHDPDTDNNQAEITFQLGIFKSRFEADGNQ